MRRREEKKKDQLEDNELAWHRANTTREETPKVACLLHAADDVRVTGVGDAHDTDAEELTAGGAELDVRALVVVHADTRKVSVVLDLRAHQGGAVVRDEDKLRLAAAEGVQGLLEAKAELAALHDKLKAGVDVVLRRELLRLSHNHCISFRKQTNKKTKRYKKKQSRKKGKKVFIQKLHFLFLISKRNSFADNINCCKCY